MKWMDLCKTALAISLALGLDACRSNNNEIHGEATEQQMIAGRDEGGGRQLVYRLQVPVNWIRHDPLPGETLADTTKALCEFIIMENSSIIRLVIHNFPSTQLLDHIPPEAQIVRWQNQFEFLDKIHSTIIPQSFSGYSGLLFSAEGKMQEKEIGILGWSLQLAPEHYRNLHQAESPKTSSLFKQMRSDVTIKAIGPKELMRKHKNSIIRSVRTFELIKEIPSHA